MFRIMSVASIEVITRKWLKTEAPKREDWVHVMHNIYIYMMERLVRLETCKLKKFWKNWVEFVSPLRSDFIE